MLLGIIRLAERSLVLSADAEEARVIAQWRAEKLVAMKSAYKALVEKNKAENRCVAIV